LADDHMSSVKGFLAMCVIWWKFKFCVLRISTQFGAVFVSMLISRSVSKASFSLLREYFSFLGS